MKNIDKYDEEVKNIDPEVVAKQKQKRADIKARILFFVKMLACHIVACIVYTVMLSPTAESQLIYGRAHEARLLAGFTSVSIVAFAFVSSLDLLMNDDYRKEFTDMMKTERFSILEYLVFTALMT